MRASAGHNRHAGLERARDLDRCVARPADGRNPVTTTVSFGSTWLARQLDFSIFSRYRQSDAVGQ
jgi:hypothetical protein